MGAKTSFTHIINPVHKPPDHELSIAQPVTFSSIDVARDHFLDSLGKSVQLVCAVYEEDEYLVPKDTDLVIRLQESFRSITGRLDAPKLPIVRELLANVAKVTTSEFVIYTNVDIAIMPYFYNAVDAHLCNGFDNLIINRRTIFPDEATTRNLDLMYALVGNRHPGYDCFVFRAGDVARFNLGNLTVGLPGFDWVMALNLWYRGGRNLGLYDHHLTFHIGDDKKWTSDAMREWQRLNYEQIDAPLDSLKLEFGEREHFVWPRPNMGRNRGLGHRLMNKIGRLVINQWPDQQ